MSNCTKDSKTQDRQEGQQLKAVWSNGGCSASYGSLVLVSSAVLRLNFCAKNPPLCKAANRYSISSFSILISPNQRLTNFSS
jgi:hypothetical protein